MSWNIVGTRDDPVFLALWPGTTTDVKFVSCLLCSNYATFNQAIVLGWYINSSLVIYCPNCK